MKHTRWLSLPITPLLAALYPFTYFLSANLTQFRVGEIWRTLLLLIATSVVIGLFFRLVWRDWSKSAMAGASLILIFLTYGHWFQWIKGTFPTFARTFLWFPLAVGFIALILWAIWRSNRDLSGMVAITNLILFALTIISLVPITSYLISINQDQILTNEPPNPQNPTGTVPDVFLIVLDEYTRSDMLLQKDEFDNSGFLRELDELGFVTIPCSQPNYLHTDLSMYTMLNLDYLGKLPNSGEVHRSTLTTTEIAHDLRYSLFSKSLKRNRV